MTNFINAAGRNWKTTVAGIAMMLAAIGTAVATLLDNNPETGVDVETLVNTIMVAIGLLSGGIAALSARDGDKSSEDSGIK